MENQIDDIEIDMNNPVNEENDYNDPPDPDDMDYEPDYEKEYEEYYQKCKDRARERIREKDRHEEEIGVDKYDKSPIRVDNNLESDLDSEEDDENKK